MLDVVRHSMIQKQLVALGTLVLMQTMGYAQQPYEAARREMVEQAVRGAGVTDPRVLQAMRDTPRHEFVAAEHRPRAYLDMALPIGHQQTISSPFIVAFMTQCLDPQPGDKVLEIGTGSGYQAAVLSPLVDQVFSIEIVEPLGRKAAETLQRLGYENVVTKVGDGFQGWPEHAPFDKIIVTCSPEKPPQPLIDQLKEGGLMVIPAGRRYQQTLYVMRKTNGQLQAEALRPTLFVPMTGIAENNRRVQPDPANPQAVNGDFETPPGDNGFLPGWYYQRQLRWETDPHGPQGDHCIHLHNEEPGRSAHVLQGIPVDGRRVRRLQVSAQVKYEQVRYPLLNDSFPAVAITFYDAQRRELGHYWLGPFQGTSDWRRVKKTFRLPAQAREGILRVGLFGATGDIWFDDVRIEAVGQP